MPLRLMGQIVTEWWKFLLRICFSNDVYYKPGSVTKVQEYNLPLEEEWLIADYDIHPRVYEVLRKINIDPKDVKWVYHSEFTKANKKESERLYNNYRLLTVPKDSGKLFLLPKEIV